MVELYFYSPICLHGVVVNYISKYRDNFTFVLSPYSSKLFTICRLKSIEILKKNRGFRLLANYADRATAAPWRSSTNFCG
jgi:hypothetical protein